MSRSKDPHPAIGSKKSTQQSADVFILKKLTEILKKKVEIQRDALRVLDQLNEKYKDYL